MGGDCLIMARKAFLTADEERDLIAKAQAGCIASRNTLVERNLGYIYKVCYRFCERWTAFDAEEVLGQAVLGYMHAIEKFDLGRTTRLSTYAGHWMWQYLRLLGADELAVIHVPHYLDGRKEHDNQADADRARKPMSSLSRPVRSDSSEDGADIFVAAPEKPQAPDMPTEEEVRAAIASLPERWAMIIERRIEGKTLREIGDELGVTRERVRQLEARSRAYILDQIAGKLDRSLLQIYRAVS